MDDPVSPRQDQPALPHAPTGSTGHGPGAESRPELSAVLRLTGALVSYFDRDKRIRLASPGAALNLGLPESQLLGRTPDEMGLPDDRREQLNRWLDQVVAMGEPLQVTTSAEVGDTVQELELKMVPDKDRNGAVRGVVVTAWDVTAQVQTAGRASHLDRIYRILGATNQLIVHERDRDKLLAGVCRIAVDLGGFTLAWIGIEQPDGELAIAASDGRDKAALDGVHVSARDVPTGQGAMGTAIRSNASVAIADVRNDRRMNAWRSELTKYHFRTCAAFPLRRHGVPFGALALYSREAGFFVGEEMKLFEELVDDLSFALDSLDAEQANAAAEQRLRESEQRYRYLFERNPYPMWVFDVETLRFLAVNEAAIRVYGYTEAEFLSMSLLDIRPAEDATALRRNVAAPGEGYRPPGLWRLTRKDGSMLDVEVTAHDIEFAGHKARLSLVLDVTEKLRLEAQLAEAARMEAMGLLAGGIAHDFNNILVAVNGYSELLLMELGDSPLADEVREIKQAGDRAKKLTGQILAFARRQEMHRLPIDLNRTVDGVSRMLRRLIGEQVELVARLDAEPAVVLADQGQIEQVLTNLAINSRDAMPHGGTLEIGVRHVENGALFGHGTVSGPAVLLTVADNGVGMDPETLVHAFEPFFTTKGPHRGTGLGLSTVYGIVTQSNGDVWAESTVGQGTTVSILLGCVNASPDVGLELPAAPVERAKQATILVVEDDPAVRRLVVSSLERIGYRVLVASSPSQAVALAGLDAEIDVLVSDLIMPETDGRTLANRLLETRPAMGVVLMSGYNASAESFERDGKFLQLAKPFGHEQLRRAVEKALAEQSR